MKFFCEANGSGTAKSPNHHKGNRGDGYGKIHFWFVVLVFLGGFPDRNEITVETTEHGGSGRNPPENGCTLAKSGEFHWKLHEIRLPHDEIRWNRAETRWNQVKFSRFHLSRLYFRYVSPDFRRETKKFWEILKKLLTIYIYDRLYETLYNLHKRRTFFDLQEENLCVSS